MIERPRGETDSVLFVHLIKLADEIHFLFHCPKYSMEQVLQGSTVSVPQYQAITSYTRDLTELLCRVESLEFYFQYGVVSKIYKDNNLIALPIQLAIPLNVHVGKYSGRDRLFIELRWFSSRSKCYLIAQSFVRWIPTY